MDFFSYFSFIIRQILYKIKYYFKRNRISIIIFIALVVFFFIQNTCFAVDLVDDWAQDIVRQEEVNQNNFALHCWDMYTGNTEAWTDQLKPMFDLIDSQDYDFKIGRGSFTDRATYRVVLYHKNECTVSNGNWEDSLTGATHSIQLVSTNNSGAKSYLYTWYYSTNTQNLTITNNYSSTFPLFLREYKSPLMIEFINTIKGNHTNDYTSMLTAISNYLDSIDTVNSDILTSLNSIVNSLTSINTNTSTNYSQQIGGISNQISDILTDNDTVISQNTQMIQQQEEINDNLETIDDSIQETTTAVTDLKDTITDSTVDDDSLDLPSVDVANPAQQGIENLFLQLYDAFCTDVASDIVIPVPFTNQSFSIPYNLTYDALHNNGGDILISIITAFWWYKLGGWVVFDIYDKIIKIQQGDAEEVQTSNISKDML